MKSQIIKIHLRLHKDFGSIVEGMGKLQQPLLKVKYLELKYGLGRCFFVSDQILVLNKNWTKEHLPSQYLNTSSLTDSYIVFILKMESVSKNTIFGLKMMVKSGLEKIILKSLHARRQLFSLLNFRQFYEVRESSLPHGGISKIFFLGHFSPLFLGQKLYFWIQIPF